MCEAPGTVRDVALRLENAIFYGVTSRAPTASFTWLASAEETKAGKCVAASGL